MTYRENVIRISLHSCTRTLTDVAYIAKYNGQHLNWDAELAAGINPFGGGYLHDDDVDDNADGGRCRSARRTFISTPDSYHSVDSCYGAAYDFAQELRHYNRSACIKTNAYGEDGDMTGYSGFLNACFGDSDRYSGHAGRYSPDEKGYFREEEGYSGYLEGYSKDTRGYSKDTRGYSEDTR